MDEIILTAILLVVFIAHIFIAKFFSIPEKTWEYVFLYVVALDVAPMSHLWHLMYGEDRIDCPQRKNEIFGWTPCFVLDWNTLVNTYEITLSIEFLFLSAISFYVLFDLFESIMKNILVFVLNTIHAILALILLFSTPLFLDSFASLFDLLGLIVSSLLLVLVELYVRIPYFGYRRA